MKNTDTYLMIILVLVISSCSQNHNRKMWQSSYSSIGVEPNDDAPVKSGAESSLNFAQEKTLTIAHGQSMAYLKYFIPGFSRLDSAILRMQTKEIRSAGQVDVYQVMDIDWDETQLTWDRRPEIGDTVLLSLMIDKSNKIYEFDLTEHVASKLSNNDYYICLCVKAHKPGTSVSFASVEDYQNLKPRFMVSGLTYVPPPPPEYAPDKFTHPGILLMQKQIEFVRSMIQSNRSPWK